MKNDKNKDIFYKSWSAINYDYIDELLHMFNNFSKSASILIYLMTISNKQNMVCMSIVEMAQIIDLHIIQTRKYMKILEEYNFISIEKVSNMSVITINPFFTKKAGSGYVEKNTDFKKGYPKIPDCYKNKKSISVNLKKNLHKGILSLKLNNKRTEKEVIINENF